MKNSEKVIKSDAPIILTVYEALHMKIYEAPSYEFWRAAIAGKRRAVPGSTRSAGQRREASDSVGNCGNKLKY